MGLAVWCMDQAGPFQTLPYPGTSWQPQGHPRQQAHEYIREGTAKLLTLFHPASGQVRAKGVTSCTNQVLHPWLKHELSMILTGLPATAAEVAPDAIRQQWLAWYEGLSQPPDLPEDLPPVRLLLVLDNLAGHKTASWVAWCRAHGIALLYTPLGASWLNMAESVQRIIQGRALKGHHASTDYRTPGGYRARLEPQPDPLRVGRQARRSQGPRTPTAPGARWLRRLCAAHTPPSFHH